jgi:hypothetical protein
MSSVPSAVVLEADERSRLLVMACAAVLHLSGLLLLLNLPTAAISTALLLCGWLYLCYRDWHRQLCGYRRIAGIRIDGAGAIESIDTLGNRQGLRLLSGSFVLPRLAWLRLGFRDRKWHSELLMASRCEARGWHWLQLCWRQQGKHFGRFD